MVDLVSLSASVRFSADVGFVGSVVCFVLVCVLGFVRFDASRIARASYRVCTCARPCVCACQVAPVLCVRG